MPDKEYDEYTNRKNDQSEQSAEGYCKGIVKQILSGDAVLVQTKGKGKAPGAERQIFFSNVIAPKLGRRGTSSQGETADEPFAWEAREYLRKKVFGKEVIFLVETKTPSGREYGTVYHGKDPNRLMNMTELMVSEGLLTVRRDSIRSGDDNIVMLEEDAQAKGKGKWTKNTQEHVRDVKWNIDDNLSDFVESRAGRPIKAVIEHVRDGSTVRALLMPDYYHVTLMISGIRCPMFKVDGDGRPDKVNAEPFAEEARSFVETRLLQRDVEVYLETYNNNNLVGSIKHTTGNIAELLLQKGLAKCVDWSIMTATGGPERLRRAERSAKNKKLRIWSNYTSNTLQIPAKDRSFNAVVVEIVNGDSLVVKRSGGAKAQKIFLSSIRPPRAQDFEGRMPQTQRVGGEKKGGGFRPLYDIPFLFDAREFLRKTLIGKNVSVTVDFVQAAQANFPEKTCCTVKYQKMNVALELVQNGLATVVRYRQDDDQRSVFYDQLMMSEQGAMKEGVGLHSKDKTPPVLVINDFSGDPTKAKSFFPFLQRGGELDAIVEFVASGSRMRLFMQRDSCLITFLLAGITCPRSTRPAAGGNATTEGEPYGVEAHEFTRDNVMQRNVKVQIESMDKGGNFIGWLHAEGKNLSVMLVEKGLSTKHATADSSQYAAQLTAAEKFAFDHKRNIWANYFKEKRNFEEENARERKLNYRMMLISEVCRNGRLYAQNCSDAADLEVMMKDITNEFNENAPEMGSYVPKKGDMCAAKFVDNCWYRAKVERVVGGGAQVSIFYLDYGNREVTDSSSLAELPAKFKTHDGFAKEFGLALVKFHTDEDSITEAMESLQVEVMDREVQVNWEYLGYGNIEHVTIRRPDTGADVGLTLLTQGHVMVDERSEQRFKKLLVHYKAAEDNAKKQHLNIWRYGDVTADDPADFDDDKQ